MHDVFKESILFVMTELPNKQNIDIIPYRFDLEIIADVIRQLEKDVVLSGGSLEIPSGGYNDIFLLKEVITDYVSQISVTNATLLFNLFYRIDIPQEMIEHNPGDLAELLLKRELLKVLTRRFYNKK